MGGTAKALAVLLTSSLFSFGEELKACYRAYFAFVPVAETCIGYRREANLLKVESFARTVGTGKLVKRVYNKGGAVIELPELKPKRFFYHQEEGEFKRYQEYTFVNDRIRVVEVHFVSLSQEVERREEKEYEYRGFVDPYTASLMLYKESAKAEQGTIKMFYDDKEYQLPYRVKGKEKVETPAGNFLTRKVDVQPNIETKGLLRPRGTWRLWLDEETNIPVKMELKFVIGSATARLESMQGDKNLMENLLRAKR
ncbi:MAG: DUF3108 domain-containing protein [Aquificaceae bacterium]|nr:DUF3108 domain-containing protein [Aquificaceae bacterium]MDW8097422.1 DUF3108 domain-containing protein [Aquificaceae bacterium]